MCVFDGSSSKESNFPCIYHIIAQPKHKASLTFYDITAEPPSKIEQVAL